MPIRLNNGNRFILGDLEILENIAGYIRKYEQKEHWDQYARMIAPYIAFGIGWHKEEVIGYFDSQLSGLRNIKEECRYNKKV